MVHYNKIGKTYSSQRASNVLLNSPVFENSKPTPFFNSSNTVQRQVKENEPTFSNEIEPESTPKFFTKPKVFWALENDSASKPLRVLYSPETVTAEQLSHAMFNTPEKHISSLAQINSVSLDQPILPYTKIRIPRINTVGTSWAQMGYNNSLRFRGSASNPYPILNTMGISSSHQFAKYQNQLETQLKVDLPLMLFNIQLGLEDKFLELLKKYANNPFTDFPDRYPFGGQYVDKIFFKLRGEIKRIRRLGVEQVTSYYDIIFNHFKKSDEVAVIRDTNSYLFKGDNGIPEVSFASVFVEVAFERALQAAGVPRENIMKFINNAGEAVTKIISKPGKFLSNLIGAVKLGFKQFVSSLPNLLGPGLLDWALRNIGIDQVELPKDFSIKSILKMALKILEIDFKDLVQEVIGNKNLQRLEKVWSIVQSLLKGEMKGLLVELEAYLGDLKMMLISNFKNWVIKDFIKSAITEMLQMFVPGGGLVKVIKKIYRIIKFVKDKLKELKDLFVSIGQAVLPIVNGNIVAASSMVTESLKKGLSLLMDLLARVMKINVFDGIKNAILGLRNTIKNAIKKVIENLIKSGKIALAKTTGKLASWWNINEKFFSKNGNRHTVYIKKIRDKPRLVIESTPIDVGLFLRQKQEEIRSDESLQKADKNMLLSKVKHTNNLLKGLQALMNRPADEENPRIPGMILEITDNIKIIDVSGSSENVLIPSAEFNPGFIQGVKATSFSARYLFSGSETTSKNHEEGSPPSNSSITDAWQVLRDMGINYRWVRFHIINENLGGKGVDSNLIPTPTYINIEYRDEFENPIKNYYKSGIPVWIRARINYDTANFNGYFPSDYTAQGGGMIYQNDRWIEDPSRHHSFYKRIDNPQPKSFNINSIMADPSEDYLIKNLTSVTQEILNILRNNLPPGGYQNFRQMESVIERHIYGDLDRTIEEYSEESISQLEGAPPNQVRKAERLKNWLRSANFTY